MSNTIYSIQEKLDSILDIEGQHTIPDSELFDCSDYPDDGKGSGHFDNTGIPHSEETKRLMSFKKMGNKNALGHKQTEEQKKNTSIAMKKARAKRFWSTKKKIVV